MLNFINTLPLTGQLNPFSSLKAKCFLSFWEATVVSLAAAFLDLPDFAAVFSLFAVLFFCGFFVAFGCGVSLGIDGAIVALFLSAID